MSFSKFMVLVVVFALGSAFLLTLRETPSALAAPTVTASRMYESQLLIGTIITAEQMYLAEDMAWYSSTLRLDEVQTMSKLKVGDIIVVRYKAPKNTPALTPKVGDQVRAHGKLIKIGGKSVFTLSDLVISGRGEFIRPGEGATFDMGSPNAKVLVKMMAPLQTACHLKTMDLLKDIAEREKDRMRLQIYNMATPEGRREMQREGLNCATVLVNNRYRFIIQTPNGPRKVAFHHHPNDPNSNYNSEDVITVIEQEIKRLY